MSRNKKILCVLLVFVIFAVFTVLICFAFLNKSVCGVYFRESYGSLGFIGSSGQLYLQAYSFESNPIFNEESVAVWLDSDSVHVQNTEVSLLKKIKNMTVYDIILNISFDEYGEYSVSQLYFLYGENSECFYIGDIELFNIDGVCYTLPKAGMIPGIIAGKAYLNVVNSVDDFIIKRVILTDSEWFSYSYDSNISVTAGEETSVTFDVKSNVSNEKWLILHPLYEIELKDSGETVYFSSLSDFYSGDSLTYDDIVEKIVK